MTTPEEAVRVAAKMAPWNSSARYARVQVVQGAQHPPYGIIEVSPDGERWRPASPRLVQRYIRDILRNGVTLNGEPVRLLPYPPLGRY